MAEVKERPIIFSGPMVRAILAGRKTQTRRVVVPQPDWSTLIASHLGRFSADLSNSIVGASIRPCRYGEAGDRLWVRETINGVFGCDAFYSSDETQLTEAIGWDWVHKDNRALPVKVIPSIHMPRWASRITLEITGVRVERLQAISGSDARAEGVKQTGLSEDWEMLSSFHELWDSINSKRGHSWESNPWVWVIEFRNISGVGLHACQQPHAVDLASASLRPNH